MRKQISKNRRNETQRKSYNKHKLKRQAESRTYYKKHRKELLLIIAKKVELKRKRELIKRKKRSIYNKKWYRKNKERKLEMGRKYYRKNKVKYARVSKNRHLQSYYGVSIDAYEKIYNKQHGRCAICGVKRPYLSMDHNHKDKQIRGLLCKTCNWGLGHFREDIRFFKNAIKYLNKWRKQNEHHKTYARR